MNSSSKTNLDERFDPLKPLASEARSELSDLVSWFETQEGDSIYQQGAPGLGTYLLYEGSIKQYRITPQGKKLIFELRGPGSIVGTETLFNKENHIATAEVISGKATVGFLERNNFFEFMEDHPSLLFGFANYLSTKAMAFKLKLVESCYLGSKQRMSRLILAGDDSNLSVSRKKLARLTGVSYKTAIQVLGELEKRNLIETSEHEITVTDREGLKDIIEPLPLEMEEEGIL